jgi:hypothetical protein
VCIVICYDVQSLLLHDGKECTGLDSTPRPNSQVNDGRDSEVLTNARDCGVDEIQAVGRLSVRKCTTVSSGGHLDEITI